MGYIEAICISEKKGVVKIEVPHGNIKEDWGIEGDAHAGKWHRQVSLLAGESIDRMKEMIPELEKGAFAENIITRGVGIADINIGEKISIGQDIVLEVTQIGKECHHGCAIRVKTGDCIMPREGIFTKVIKGGSIKPGDTININ